MTELAIVRSYAAPLEVGDGRTIVGRVVPFDEPAMVCDPGGEPYRERIMRGAFSRVVKAPQRVLLNYEHRPSLVDVIGRATELEETDDGLHATFRALDGLSGDQGLELIRSGAVTGFSLEAVVTPAGTETAADGTVERHRIARLSHVALTGSPAYAGAGVLALRSAPPAGISEVRAWMGAHALRSRAE